MAHALFYTGFLITETLFVFTCMLFLYLLVRVEDSPTVLWAALAGLLLGLVNLIRPTLLLFPAFLFFWAWMSFRTLNRAAVITGIVVGVMVVTILPWTVRNYVVTGALVPIVTTHWVTLYGAHNEHILNDPEAIGGWVQPRPMDEAVYRSEYFSFLKHYLFHEPETLVMLGLHKLKRFWSIFPKTKTARRDGIISLCSYGLLLPFFLSGLYLSLKRSRPPWVLFCWILYFCFLTLITHGTTRYRLPVEPAIILFASSTLERIRLRWSKTQSAVPPVEEKGKRGQAFG